jgi:hypothetical protein
MAAPALLVNLLQGSNRDGYAQKVLQPILITLANALRPASPHRSAARLGALKAPVEHG